MPLFSETHHRDHRDHIPTTHTPEPATLGFSALVLLVFGFAIYFRGRKQPQ